VLRADARDEGEVGMHLEREAALRRAAAADHGVLATLHHSRGDAHLVPVCFAIDGDRLAIPIDSVKPKGSTALGRIRNLEHDPRATLLVEHWDAADWSRLWWVHLRLVRTTERPERTTVLEQGLRDRYAQYATARFVDILTFRIDHIAGWAASKPEAAEA
jgi:PPOX class probable F420-dependent enzyme